MDQNNSQNCYISLILRVAIISLLTATAIAKFIGGLNNVSLYIQDVFKNTWLPSFLITIYGHAIPFIEVILPLWLLVGFRLKAAWITTAFFFITLAFGMVVVKQYPTASDNFMYVVISCLGLYFSQYDRCNLDCLKKK